MSNMIRFLLVFVTFLVVPQALAHGEDKLGPHQGYIRMPGAFHIEVVPKGEDQFELYLLTLTSADPTVERSVATASIKSGLNKSMGVTCVPNVKKFICMLPAGAKLNQGTLEINATRFGFVGAPVTYTLPFKLGVAH